MGFLLFIYPFAEIYAYYRFILVYSFLDALFLAIGSVALGLFILTTIGRSALGQIQQDFAKASVPQSAVLHKGLIMFGGLLFFLPGLINDVVGLLCVMPGTRHLILLWLKNKLSQGILKGRVGVFTTGFGFPGGASRGGFRFERGPVDINDFRSDEERAAQARDATVIDIRPLPSRSSTKPDDD